MAIATANDTYSWMLVVSCGKNGSHTRYNFVCESRHYKKTRAAFEELRNAAVLLVDKARGMQEAPSYICVEHWERLELDQ